MSDKSVFETLATVNVNDKTEKKNGLTYLSWSFAWAEVKKLYPDTQFTIYETVNPQGFTCNYFTDGKTCWVKVGVTINGQEYIEELPVMDFKNKSIPYESVTSVDVNKAIQRCKTKAIAYHGLGIYIYSGEDLPETVENFHKPTDEHKKEYAALVQENGADGNRLFPENMRLAWKNRLLANNVDETYIAIIAEMKAEKAKLLGA